MWHKPFEAQKLWISKSSFEPMTKLLEQCSVPMVINDVSILFFWGQVCRQFYDVCLSMSTYIYILWIILYISMYLYLYTHLNIYIYYATKDGDESRLEHIILKEKKQLMKCACSRPSFGGNCPFGIHVKYPKHWKILSFYEHFRYLFTTDSFYEHFGEAKRFMELWVTKSHESCPKSDKMSSNFCGNEHAFRVATFGVKVPKASVCWAIPMHLESEYLLMSAELQRTPDHLWLCSRLRFFSPSDTSW